MARYLSKLHYFILSFVVVLWLCSTSCVTVYASGGDEEELRGELFEPKQIDDVKGLTGVTSVHKKPITLCEIGLPFFFAAKDSEMVVVAKAKYTEEVSCSTEPKVDILAKFIDTKNSNQWNKEKVKEAITNGKTQFVTEDNKEANVVSTIVASTGNANEDKIYVLLLNDITTGPEPKWQFKLVTGTIGISDGSSKTINWKSEESKEAKNVGRF